MVDVLDLIRNPKVFAALAGELAHAKVEPSQKQPLIIDFDGQQFFVSQAALDELRCAVTDLFYAVHKVKAIAVDESAYNPSLSSCNKCGDCCHWDANSSLCWLPELQGEAELRRPDFPACAGFRSVVDDLVDAVLEAEDEF